MRNSVDELFVDELFVECTCDVFGVDVCVVFEKLLSCCPAVCGRLCASPCMVFQ